MKVAFCPFINSHWPTLTFLISAVIMNEHLIEALRRLHRNSSENSVDRALVTNVLLNFLSRPREDQKRFEMLSILANMLSWTDIEREKAGLQRSLGTVASSNSGGATSSFWSSRTSMSSPTLKPSELEKSDETEVRICLPFLCFCSVFFFLITHEQTVILPFVG
jgi:hypothetical protein